MQKNELLQWNNTIIRILTIDDARVLVIDCVKRTMPQWINSDALTECNPCEKSKLEMQTEIELDDFENLNIQERRIAHERYTMIAGVLPFIADESLRSMIIDKIADEKKVSKQTVRRYLCLYLAFDDMSVLCSKRKIHKKTLTEDEKNIRWALNKFFYTSRKNSLQTAYTLMLKEKYCDKNGVLLPTYPTIHQFRYFYRKNRKMQTYYISRNGLKDYQKNHRPLLGDGVQQFAPNIGVGMLDATICDIYLVDDAGSLIGRPILTVCVDAHSSLCCGYSLTWEGGLYSLRGLMLNILEDKQQWCKKFGISFEKNQWDCSNFLPGIFVTDMGTEYKSSTFEQISELGITVVNLPAYRPELKSVVEKFFDLIQNTYKPFLKGRGVIEPDFQERGAHDYRKDACLTLRQFEQILLKAILYYNSKRIIENYPYTDNMLSENIQPFACAIWEYGKNQDGANLIPVEKEQVIMALLPRTTGKFTRSGLKVNQMRYKCDGYTEEYLNGGEVTVAFNPDDVSFVWLVDKGNYIRFELIESRYKEKNLTEIQMSKTKQKELVMAAKGVNNQGKIDLVNYIENITAAVGDNKRDTNVKGIRDNRRKEQANTHIDYMGAV